MSILSSVLLLTAPILLTALGGMISERSGVTNIALEGLMVIGACLAACVQYFCLKAGIPLFFSVSFSLLSGCVASAIFSLIHALCSINFNADQTISGVGLNMLADGVALSLCQLFFQADRSKEFSLGMLPMGQSGIYPSAIISLFIILGCWVVMYKMPSGYHMRACGEHPSAAESAGINVRLVRWISVTISGALGGLAGACCVLTQSTQFSGNLINGKGYIALAAVAFGRWNPKGVFLASVLFGAAQAMALIANNFQSLGTIPSEVWTILPYLITLIALIVFSGKNYAPKSLGKPFAVSSS